MTYKTILVQVDGSSNVDQRIQVAANIALVENARLIGVANTGISRFLHETMAVFPDSADFSVYLDILRQRADRALENFEHIARPLGVNSLEGRLVDNETANGISVQARYSDLAVLGQYNPEDPFSMMMHDLPEYVAMNSGTPVLVIPSVGKFDTVGERILIGWNGSLQAARAVRYAMPLLKRAKSVHVVLFNPVSQPDEFVLPMSSNIAAFLASHGVQSNVLRKPCNDITEGGMGSLLLSAATELAADMLVMGCYGHWRFREILLGGASRTVLESMTVPVFMAH
jgi:nucleotide-binding universal stress UspA family protein